MSERRESRCPTCLGSGLVPLDDTAKLCLHKGLKAGTCGDWLECSDCGGTGKFIVYEHRVNPSRHILVQGLRT